MGRNIIITARIGEIMKRLQENSILILFILALLCIPMSSAVLTDELKSYYNFNEGSGNVLIDIISGINGTISPTLNYTNGIIGGGIRFYANSYISIPDNAINSPTNFTINIWVNYTSYNTGSNALFSKWNDPSNDAYLLKHGASNYSLRFLTTTTGSYVAGKDVTFNTTISSNNWYMITAIYNKTYMMIYVNGINIGNTTFASGNLFDSTTPLLLGSETISSAFLNGTLDEMGIWHRQLSNAEIMQLYNNGSGLTYPFNTTVPGIPVSYSVNTTQVPSDLNSSLIGLLYINATVINLTSNNTVNNNSYAELYYNITVNTTCAIFENQQCVNNGSTIVVNMTKRDDYRFNYTLTERQIFPGYYPFTESYIDNAPTRYNYSLYLNNNIRFIINNFTTYINPFISIELGSDAVSASSLLQVYYCNSSYNSGNPSLSSNCELVDTYTNGSLLPSHQHNNTKHVVLPINIRNVTKTQNSSIIFYNTQTIANGWNIAYVLNASYNNRSFQIGQTNSWTYTPNIFDIHIHQFLPTDSLKYYVKFHDGAGFSNISANVTDYFDVKNQPPSAPFIYLPNSTMKITVSSLQNSSIYFAWTPSYDFENDTLRYTLRTSNILASYAIVNNLTTSNNSYTWSTNKNYIPAGAYTVFIDVCDNESNCNTGAGFMTLCENNYVKSIQPCLGDTRLISYYDANGCDTALDVPSDNGTYESCQTIVYNQTVWSDDVFILLILGFMLILCTAGGIFVHPAFFGAGALMIALMMTVSIYYNYDDIITYAFIFMIIVYAGMWVLAHNMRK